MTESNIDNISRSITNGEIVLYPTETVWGIGCSPYNGKAIKRLYKIKKRAENKPLILLVSSVEMVLKFAPNVNQEEINELQSPHPTSVILSNIFEFPYLPKGSNSSIAFRITKHKVCQKIINQTQQPLISTSANFAGEKEALCRTDISPQLLNLVDYVWNETTDNERSKTSTKASRIVQIVKGKVVILRE